MAHYYHVVILLPSAGENEAFEAVKARLLEMGFDWVDRLEETYRDAWPPSPEERKEKAVEFVENLLERYQWLMKEIGDMTVREALEEKRLELEELLVLRYEDSTAGLAETVWVAKKKGVDRLVITSHEQALKAIRLITAAKDILYLDSHY